MAEQEDSMRKMLVRQVPDWTRLLAEAVKTPGTLSSAYHQFWNYSVGNQLLAWFECLTRGLQPGPIHTFRGWLDLGRHVKKGERAITLCMPVQVKAKLPIPTGNVERANDADTNEDATAVTSKTKTIFVFRPHWFVLSQTEGEPYVPTELPAWSEAKALAALDIARIEFDHLNGNCQGFARERQVAVSPIAALPHKTFFHELAHVLLGHTTIGPLDDHEQTPRSLREVEAECVALIACESLELPGATECRGYIQHWLSGETIPEVSAQKIFKAADALLKAGRPLASSD
jgi:antirestriction protein ArdC